MSSPDPEIVSVNVPDVTVTAPPKSQKQIS